MQRMLHVHAIVRDGGADRIPAFGLDLLSGARAAIVLGRHLRQQSIAQSERRIAESVELATLQQFQVNGGAGHNDFSAPWSDAGKLLASFERQPRQQLCDPSHLRLGDGGSARAFGFVKTMTNRGQRFRRPGSRDHDFRASPFDAVRDTLDFAVDETPQLAHLGFARRIVMQKFIGQTHRAKRQADGIADVALR